MSNRSALSDSATCWGVVFAAVHVYWALAGADAVGVEGPRGIGASIYIGFIALLGLAAAITAFGIGHPSRVPLERSVLRTLARAAGIVLLAGVAIGVARWIAAGAIGADEVSDVAITAYFAIGGALFVSLGWPDRHLGLSRRQDAG